MTLEERIARGQHADRLLSDEMFVAASVAFGLEVKEEAFRTTHPEHDKREALYAEFKGLQRALERLNKWRSDGMIAAAELAKRG
jgi:hypothetical protein